MSWKALMLGVWGALLVSALSGCDGAAIASSSGDSTGVSSASCRLCASDYILSAEGVSGEALKTREVTLHHEPGYISSTNAAARFLAVSLTETKMWLVYDPPSSVGTTYEPVLVSLFDGGANLLAEVTITAEITRYSRFNLYVNTYGLSNELPRGAPIQTNEAIAYITVNGSHADWEVIEYSEALELSALAGVGRSGLDARLREGYVQLDDETEHIVRIIDKHSNRELIARFSSFAIDNALAVNDNIQTVTFDVDTTAENLTKTFTVRDQFGGDYPALLSPWEITNADEGLTFSQLQGNTEQETALYVTVDPSFIPGSLCFDLVVGNYQGDNCYLDYSCKHLCIETQTNIPILKQVDLTETVEGQATRIYLNLAHKRFQEDYPDPLSAPDHRTVVVEVAGREIEVELSKDSYTRAYPVLVEPLAQGQYDIKATGNTLSPVKTLTVLPAATFSNNAELLGGVKSWFFNAETQQLNVLNREGVVTSLVWLNGAWVATGCEIPEHVLDIEITPNTQLAMTADVIYQYSSGEGTCVFDELPGSRGGRRVDSPPYTRFIYSSFGGGRQLVFSRGVILDDALGKDFSVYFYTSGVTWPYFKNATESYDLLSIGQFSKSKPNRQLTEYYMSGNRSAFLAYDPDSGNSLRIAVSRYDIAGHKTLIEDNSFPFNTFVSFDYVGDRFVSAHQNIFEYSSDEEKYLEIMAIPAVLEGDVLSSSMGANGKVVYRLIWVDGALKLNRYKVDNLMAGNVTAEVVELPLLATQYKSGESVKILAIPGGNNLLISYGEHLLSVVLNSVNF